MVELIPVIEITNYDEGIKSPDSGPFWKYPDEWESFNNLTNSKAGFSDKLKSYLKGSSLYKIDEITNDDLYQAVLSEIKKQEPGDEDDDILACAFSGGYVLRINNDDKYFPQCCGDLADIREWENLINGNTRFFYPGHPFPKVTIDDNKLYFDFVDIEIKENFAPPVSEKIIVIKKSELEAAIKSVKYELEIFIDRLKNINKENNLNIPNIECLVFG